MGLELQEMKKVLKRNGLEKGKIIEIASSFNIEV